MKAKGTKFISLFLVFSFGVLITPVTAKERRGAELEILKIDAQRVRGELIAVKQDSLLLLKTEGSDVSVNIVDVKSVLIIKKSKFLKGMGIGFLSGALLGGLLGAIGGEENETWPREAIALLFAGIGSGTGLLVGGILGANAGKDKVLQIWGKSDSELKVILEELRKNARIPDYK